MIQIINYGLGNLGSVQNMLKKIDVQCRIVSKPTELTQDKIILPGVGSFDTGVKHLREMGWIEPLNEIVIKNKVPTLGICLGMQLMTDSSEEGKLNGLGWVSGNVVKFSTDKNLKVPHMGWSAVRPANQRASVLQPMNDEELRFYFVHSYYVELSDPADQLGVTDYGGPFTSAFQHGNIIGVQFHPEKSHRYGMDLLRNFSSL